MTPLHRAKLQEAGALILALALAPYLLTGATLPWSGWGIALLADLFSPGEGKTGPSPISRHFPQHLLAQITVAISLLIARAVFLDFNWCAFVFIPIWMGFALLLLIRQQPKISHEIRGAGLKAGIREVANLGRKRLTAYDDVAISGAAIAGVTVWLARALSPALQLPSVSEWILAGLWFVIDRAPFRRWQESPTQIGRLTRFCSRQAIWTALVTGLAAFTLPHGFPREAAAWLVLGNIFLVGFGLTHTRRLIHGSENLRRTLLVTYAFWLVHPFVTTVVQGSGDGAWYANTIADVLIQKHAGVFPIFVGQSEFMFNGGIYPLRLAPLLQHYSMVVDVFALGTLDAGSVMNLVLVLVAVAACLVTYTSLVSLAPKQRWACAGLTLLYLNCPGTLALVYGSDLYMTWTTLPWLPLAFCGCVRSFRGQGLRSLLEITAGLAMCWWGHAPVALWATLIIGLIQVIRLYRIGFRFVDWRTLGTAGGAFMLLSLYPFISVLAVPIEPGTPNIVYLAPLPTILAYLQQTFPGMLLPLSREIRSLADLQAGWGILVIILASAIIAIRHRVRAIEFWSLVGAAATLFLLLLPLPGLAKLLWTLAPGFIRNPTGVWPMQRFYIIIATCVIFASVSLSGTLQNISTGLKRLGGVLLFVALVWSSFEAQVLLACANRNQERFRSVQSQRLPENNLLTRYSYLVFAKAPPYFSHGFMDPLLEQRLLDRDRQQLLISNAQSVTSNPEIGHLISSGDITGKKLGTGPGWQFEPTFQVAPGQRYALEFSFLHPDVKGVLVVGGHTLSRIYELPSHGGELAFGSSAAASKVLSLFSSSREMGEINLKFSLAESDLTRDLSSFAGFRWLQYDPQDLPVRIDGWIPYQAQVRAPSPAWLETSRMFQQGYEASVNGAPVAVGKSNQGLVMVPVPAGESHVVLNYRPPLLLKSAYYISLLSFFLGLATLGTCGCRGRKIFNPSSRKSLSQNI